MGKGSRPAKAKNLVLVPGVTEDVVEEAAPSPHVAVVVTTSMPPASEVGPALAGAPTPEAPVADITGAAEGAAAQPVEPDLAELRELKEQIRKEHPDWYPEFRDTFGHQFNEQLVPQLTNLSMAELGLPESTDTDRVRREVRALAFARSYLMAKAGDAEGLKAVSRDLLYFWDDRLGGLAPVPAIAPGDPAPWVHSINRLRSRQITKIDSDYGDQPRFRRFVNAVKGWTDGRWKELRAASQRVLKGGANGRAEREASELIEAVRAAENEAPRLWRKESAASVAERMGVSRGSLLSHLQARVGHEVTQDLVSASSRPDVWSGDFIWEVEPGAQAIHAYPLSHHPAESEWITAGEFRLLVVEPYGSGGVKVRVEQTGVFKEKE